MADAHPSIQPVSVSEPEVASNGDLRDEATSMSAVDNGTEEKVVDLTATDTDTPADAEQDAETQEEESHQDEIDEDDSENEFHFSALPEILDTTTRNSLYERGKDLYEKGKYSAALRCFLKCLSGLDGAAGFPYLPQCIRHVADIYYKEEEYEKAIQFIQAEKLYYETALVDPKDSRNPEDQNDDGSGETSADGVNPEIMRAEEYEGLAKMCLDLEQPQLALEYQAKATKLRQQYLGDDHPLTKRSLDFFTVVYGEVGKYQYSESVQKLTDPVPQTDADVMDSRPERPKTAMRRRKNTPAEKPVERSISKEQIAEEIREQEEWISRALLMVLFFLCLIVLIGVMFYLYCKIDIKNGRCATWKSDIEHYYMKFKYFCYTLTALPAVK